MRVLAISNNKGGVGKTTLAMHIGSALAKVGHKMLLVDADPQATLTRWCLSFEPERGLASLVAEDYGAGALIDELLVPTQLPNLQILPAGLGLENAYGQMSGLAVNRIREALDNLQAPTDLVLIDSPPRLGAVAEALLIASDFVLHPVDGGSESLVALQKLGKTVARVQKHRPSLGVLGVVVTRGQDNATHRLVEKAVGELYGQLPVRGGIPESAFVLQATARRTTVFDIAEKNRLAATCAEKYQQIAGDVAEALGL